MRKLIVLVAVLALTSVASANLLTNPSFETAGGGGSWDPADWSRSDGNDRTDINSWGGDWAAQDGSWAMKLSNWGGTPGDHYLGREVSEAVGVGEFVTFSFYVFRNQDPYFSSAYLDLGMLGGVGGDVWFSNLSFSSGLSNQVYGSGWVQYSFTVTNQVSGVTGIGAWINITGVDTPGGTDLLIDSASLTTAIPEPTAVVLLGLGGLMACMLRRKTRA